MSDHATLRGAILYFAESAHCRQLMIDLRWPDGKVSCPVCGSEKVTYLTKPRVWKCYARHIKPRFSLKTGTIFEDSPIALEKWLPAVWMLLHCKNGISSWELHRALSVTQKTAWFMLHRIRLAAQCKTFLKPAGEVEVDEIFGGGKARSVRAGEREEKDLRTWAGRESHSAAVPKRRGGVRAKGLL
jgi:transposase-like protein